MLKDDDTSGAGCLTAGPDEGVEPEGGWALGGGGGRAVGTNTRGGCATVTALSAEIILFGEIVVVEQMEAFPTLFWRLLISDVVG